MTTSRGGPRVTQAHAAPTGANLAADPVTTPSGPSSPSTPASATAPSTPPTVRHTPFVCSRLTAADVTAALGVTATAPTASSGGGCIVAAASGAELLRVSVGDGTPSHTLAASSGTTVDGTSVVLSVPASAGVTPERAAAALPGLAQRLG